MEQKRYQSRKKALTDQGIENLSKAPRGQRKELSDLETGLTLRVNDQGAKTWMLSYRIRGEGGTSPTGKTLQGKTRKMVLGQFPTLGLTSARKKAGELKEMARKGTDPNIARQGEIQQRRNDEALTFGVVAEWYLEDAALGKKVGKKGAIIPESVKQRRKDLEKYSLPDLKDRPLADITFEELDRFIVKVQKTAPAKSVPARVLGDVRAIFFYAKHKKRLIRRDPTTDLVDDTEKVERDRVLKHSELRTLWKACEPLGNYGKVVRLLALTGQRRGEVAGMQWRDLDLEKGVWRLPKEKTKAKRVSEIPLSLQALEIIEGQPRKKGVDLIFPGDGGKKMSGWSKLYKRLEKEMRAILVELTDDEYRILTKHGLKDAERPARAAVYERLAEADLEEFRLHDLRRTAGTEMAGLKVPQLVIELILNHSANMGVTGIYNRYGYADEMREALDHWANRLMTIVNPTEPGDNVVKLGERRMAG